MFRHKLDQTKKSRRPNTSTAHITSDFRLPSHLAPPLPFSLPLSSSRQSADRFGDIMSITCCRLAPHRTVQAVFPHTALQLYFGGRLYLRLGFRSTLISTVGHSTHAKALLSCFHV